MMGLLEYDGDRRFVQMYLSRSTMRVAFHDGLNDRELKPPFLVFDIDDMEVPDESFIFFGWPIEEVTGGRDEFIKVVGQDYPYKMARFHPGNRWTQGMSVVGET